MKIQILMPEKEIMIFANGHMQVRMPCSTGLDVSGVFSAKFWTHGALCWENHGHIDHRNHHCIQPLTVGIGCRSRQRLDQTDQMSYPGTLLMYS